MIAPRYAARRVGLIHVTRHDVPLDLAVPLVGHELLHQRDDRMGDR